MKDTLIISNGSAQLISQLTIVHELELSNRLIGVVRMVSKLELLDINDKNIAAEQWMLNCINVKFLGKIIRPYQIWGSSPFEKAFNLLHFKRNFKRYISQHIPDIDISSIKNIIISYRPENGDAMLFSIFKNLDKVYLNAEGNINYFKEKKKYYLPSVLKFLGIPNIYNNNPDIYFTNQLLPNKVNNVTIKKLSDENYYKIISDISSSELFNNLIKKLNAKWPHNLSILFMQPISFDWKVDHILSIYKEIIKNELKECENQILIKFHPRESIKNIEIFKAIVDTSFSSKILFIDESMLSYLPIELYSDRIKLNRAITISSTSVYYYKENKAVDIKLYASKLFLDQTQNNIQNLATFLNVNVNYINCGNY